jgi:hypothetical protein
MFAMKPGVNSVPEVCLQPDQIPEQPNQIQLHGSTLRHINSMECRYAVSTSTQKLWTNRITEPTRFRDVVYPQFPVNWWSYSGGNPLRR